eukprot:scaffold20328_cov116-Isochrysis_galbana.AAC.7
MRKLLLAKRGEARLQARPLTLVAPQLPVVKRHQFVGRQLTGRMQPGAPHAEAWGEEARMLHVGGRKGQS